MKISKEKLNLIIQEELAELLEADSEVAAALMGLAGLPRSAQDTKVDKPIIPKDLGPEDEPYTERQTVDIGDAPPTKEFIIKAAEMLNIVPSNKSDENVIYNVAMYLQNVGGDEIDAVVADARAEAEYIKADDALEEGYEHEGSMARNQLGRTAELATMIQGMISDDTNLEEWVESKITKAQDYLSSVLNYMRGESLSEAFKGKLQRYRDEEEKIKNPAAKLRREIEKLISRIQFEKNYVPNDSSLSDERKAQAKENIKELEAKLAEKQKELSSLLENISEAWAGDPEIEQTGQYADKTSEELCAMKNKLMKKEKRTAEEQKKVRQINFAIRSKQKGPKFGKVKC